MAFDRNSTTDEVISGIDLSGKIALVTGGSTGLGAETARALASRGANVTIVARSADKLAKVADDIKSATGSTPQVGTLELDKPDTIRGFAKTWLDSNSSLDILVNNAGIMATPLSRTPEGWESQFATNHLGHFLLTNLLKAPLQQAEAARVVTLASSAHKFARPNLDDPNYENREYQPLDAYGQSKTANIWFASELARRWSGDGISSFSVHPGGIETELSRNLDPSVLPMFEQMMSDPAVKAAWKTIPQGAATSVWAATSPDLAGENGLYLEDCGISKESQPDDVMSGRADYAYDEAASKKLWDLSNNMLGENFS